MLSFWKKIFGIKESPKTQQDSTGKNAPGHFGAASTSTPIPFAASDSLVREFFSAVVLGRLEEVRSLLNRDPSLALARKTGSSDTALHEAVTYNHEEIVKLLLTAKPDINARNRDGRTPLHEAAQKGFKDVAEHLIERGADVNAMDGSGHTPVHYAVTKGHKEAGELLRLQGGRDFQREIFDAATAGDLDTARTLLNQNPSLALCRTKDGLTALHWAASSGHKAVAELLLASGANVNAEDCRGNTPLHLAAESGRTEVARILIANKADVNAMNDDGKAPLWFVTVGGTVENFADLLREHGATQAEGPRLTEAAAARLFNLWRTCEIDFYAPEAGKPMLCNECDATRAGRAGYYATPVDGGYLCESCGRRTMITDYVRDGQHYRRRVVIEIGEQLYQKGGTKLMETVAYRFNALGGRTSDLSRCWDGVGTWTH